MATERSNVDTYKAAGDLSTHQYKGVMISADETVALNNHAATSGVVGVLYNKPDAAGQAAEIAIDGPVKLKLGGTVTAGQKLNCGDDGKFVAVTADNARFCALAKQGGDDDEVISAQWVGLSFIGA